MIMSPLKGFFNPIGSAAAGNGWQWNMEHVSDSDTILLFHFSDVDAGSVVTDSSSNAFSCVATAPNSTLSTAGMFGSGANMDDQYFIIPDTNMYAEIGSAFRNKLFTLEFWGKSNISDWSASGVQWFCNFFKDSSNLFESYYTTNDTIVWRYNAGGIGVTKTTTDAINTTGSFHYACVISGNMMNIFFNGSLVTSGTNTGTFSGDPVSGAIFDSRFQMGWGTCAHVFDEFAISKTNRYG